MLVNLEQISLFESQKQDPIRVFHQIGKDFYYS